MDFDVANLAIMILPMIFAITIHEAAHAFTAYKYGDNTAFIFGRMSLNPFRHIDIFGTIIVPLLSFTVGGFIFGYAKPVPYNESKLKGKFAVFWVAIAGPMSNLGQALIWAIILKILLYFKYYADYFTTPLILMSQYGIKINIFLMLFNLIPILPLDGGRALMIILPLKLKIKYMKIEPYGLIIIFILLLFGLLNKIIIPLYDILVNMIYFLIN